jgi:hypothetical protein
VMHATSSSLSTKTNDYAVKQRQWEASNQQANMSKAVNF